MMIFMTMLVVFAVAVAAATVSCVYVEAFVTQPLPSLVAPQLSSLQQPKTRKNYDSSLFSSTGSNNNNNSFDNLFKAGITADCDEEACALAKKKIKSVQDLGWKNKNKNTGTDSNRRQSSVQPKFWAWGGADELPLQDKPNYDPNNPFTPEPWLSLEDFYALVGDDTAVADSIFVALAGGRAHATRAKCEDVVGKWYSSGRKFDDGAFYATIQQGRQEFIAQWSAFLGITGFCILGIVAPTNPLQLALVGILESFK